jgi:hypothetical protein
MVVNVGELHNSWKWVNKVAIELKWVALYILTRFQALW